MINWSLRSIQVSMKFLVVLSAIAACAVASPGLISPVAPGLLSAASVLGYYGAPLAARIAAPLAAPIAAPLAASIAAPLAAPAAVAVAAPAIKSQYHAQDELGNTAFGHSEPGQIHTSVQDANGNRVGSFSYLNPTDGQIHRTDYVADALGYRVAANDLPIAPAGPIADTPEVIAARAAHLALRRARRSVLLQTPAATAPLAAPVAIAARTIAASPLAVPLAAPLATPLAAPLAAAPLAARLAAVPLTYSSIPAGIPATLTTIVNNPGHAVSYRID